MNLICYCLGTIFLTFSICILISRRNVIKNGEHTTAVVTNTVCSTTSGDMNGTVSYFPILKYNVNGRMHKVEYSTGNLRPKYKDGETVNIIYNKKNTNKIIIENDKTPLIVSITFIIVSLVLFGFGYLLNKLNLQIIVSIFRPKILKNIVYLYKWELF